MIEISSYIQSFSNTFPEINLQPWELLNDLENILNDYFFKFNKDYSIQKGIAIHKSAIVEKGAVIKGSVIVSENCFIASNSYLRGPVYLAKSVIIGPGAEIKQSIIFENTTIAHLNYIGNSIIGANVNFEAGSIVANHFNELEEKEVSVIVDNKIIKTNTDKFGALVGDHSKIGANAVLSPGTILKLNTVVNRLQLISQI